MNATEPASVRIPARSRRQAMDWSLVLASQQIEATIDHVPEPLAWGLLVRPEDFDKALSAIRLYRLENRRWGWRPQVLGPGLLFDWSSLCWVLLLCIFFYLSSVQPDFHTAGIMNGPKVSQGQWWRLFTATWLHGDLAHLAGNATLGMVLLGLAMGQYGAGIGLLGAYLAGIGGNLAVCLLWQGAGSLGASGVVMGSLGLLAAHSLSSRRPTTQSRKRLVVGLLGAVMLFVLLGLNPETDWRAHLGGFVTGACLGATVRLTAGSKQRPRLNLAAAFVFMFLVVLPWLFALRAADVRPN